MDATIDRSLTGTSDDLDAALYQASCFTGASMDGTAIIMCKVIKNEEHYRIFPNDAWPTKDELEGYDFCYSLSRDGN